MLFRKNALAEQTQSQFGDILTLPKLSHIVISTCLVIWVSLVLVLLFSRTYTEKQSVRGWITASSQIVSIFPKDPTGIIEAVYVTEGDAVQAGQVLMKLANDKVLINDDHLSKQQSLAFSQKIDNITVRIADIETNFEIQHQSLLQTSELKKVSQQLLLQQEALMSSQLAITLEKLNNAKNLLIHQHVSQITVDDIQNEYIQQQRQLLTLKLSVQQHKNEVADLIQRLKELPINKSLRINELRSASEDVSQNKLESQSQSVYLVTAPSSGVVSNLQVNIGQFVTQSTILMKISPKNQIFTAKLLVPLNAAGLIDHEQVLSIRYDAFPHQKFGLAMGQIQRVSTTLLMPGEVQFSPIQVREPVYIANASIDKQFVTAYGNDVSLKSGMTFNADVELSERSLIEWLLSPLLNLRGQL